MKLNQILFAILAMDALGLADIVRRRAVALTGSPVTYFAVESAFVAAFSVVAMFILEGKPTITRNILTLSPASGILASIGVLALLLALSSGQASRVVPVGRESFLVTFLVSVFLLHEPLTASKGFGVIVTAAAVFLLSSNL